MRKILKDTKRTRKYILSLPCMYLVSCWARWGVREFPFSGKYITTADGTSVPLVYQFDDHNGERDEWRLTRIDCTTTGIIGGWTQSHRMASACAEQYNKTEGRNG